MSGWETDMECQRCSYLDEGRSLSDMSEEEVLGVTLKCPSCDLEEGLVVVESSLRRREEDGN